MRINTNTSLSNIFESNKQIIEKPIELDKRHTCYAVLRSKGGSGETHTVKKLIDDLVDADEQNIIVCFLHEIAENNYFSIYFPDECNFFLGSVFTISDSVSGLVNCKWTQQGELNKLISILNKLDENYSVIFTCGTSSGGTLTELISAILELTNKVFISVNSDVVNSINPVRDLAKADLLSLEKVCAAWWYSEKLRVHKLSICNLLDLHRYSDSEMNENAQDLKSVSLIN